MTVDILFWLWSGSTILTVLSFRGIIKEMQNIDKDLEILEAKNTNRKKEIDQIIDYIEQEKK